MIILLQFQADLVLIKMGLYCPNFSLVLLIHLFLFAGVYCMSFECGAFMVQQPLVIKQNTVTNIKDL